MLPFIFYGFVFLVVFAALYVAVSKNLLRSLFAFFGLLLALAALYIFAKADFIALMQIMVYVGGVSVLILFALMLSDKISLNPAQSHPQKSIKIAPVVIAVLLLAMLSLLVYNIWQTHYEALPWIVQSTNTAQGDENSLYYIGAQLMSSYLLPLELISLFLLAILVGVTYIIRKKTC